MKRIDAKVYLTLFIISFLAEIYFVTQMDRDLLSILGTGVVILVSMYMAVDSFQNHLEMSYSKLFSGSADGNKGAPGTGEEERTSVAAASMEDVLAAEGGQAYASGGSQQMADKFERLETVNKAVYVSLKKSIGEMDGEFEKIQNSLQLIEEIHNDSTEETLGLSKQILALNQKLYENQTKLYEAVRSVIVPEEAETAAATDQASEIK